MLLDIITIRLETGRWTTTWPMSSAIRLAYLMILRLCSTSLFQLFPTEYGSAPEFDERVVQLHPDVDAEWRC